MTKNLPCLFIYDDNEFFIDTLAPLAALINIPLLIIDSPSNQKIQSFYPSVECHTFPRDRICQEVLKKYNVIISCHPTYLMKELFSVSSAMLNINPTFIWFPHQQKEEYSSYEHLDQERIILVWGEALLHNLQRHGICLSIFRTLMLGDIKYIYTQKMKKFYQRFVTETLFSFLPKENDTYLIAPVFHKNQDSDALITTISALIEHAPPTVNLIIKMDPMDQIHEKKCVEKIKKKAKPFFNSFVIMNYPVIPALFDQVKGLFTNNISYSYHFCIYDKPLYFLGPPPPALYSCCTPFLFEKCSTFPQLPLEKKSYSMKKMIHSLNFDHSVSHATLAKTIRKSYNDYEKEFNLI